MIPMCDQQYNGSGQRTYGANIPGFAQGAHFPGDEPGVYCKLTDERVAGLYDVCPGENDPRRCLAWTQSQWMCPNCRKEHGQDTHLLRHKDGHFFCPYCEIECTEVELAREYAGALVELTKSLEALEAVKAALEAAA